MKITLDFKLGTPPNPINNQDYWIWDNQGRIFLGSYYIHTSIDGFTTDRYTDGDEYWLDKEDIYAYSEANVDELEGWRIERYGEEN